MTRGNIFYLGWGSIFKSYLLKCSCALIPVLLLPHIHTCQQNKELVYQKTTRQQSVGYEERPPFIYLLMWKANKRMCVELTEAGCIDGKCRQLIQSGVNLQVPIIKLSIESQTYDSCINIIVVALARRKRVLMENCCVSSHLSLSRKNKIDRHSTLSLCITCEQCSGKVKSNNNF